MPLTYFSYSEKYYPNDDDCDWLVELYKQLDELPEDFRWELPEIDGEDEIFKFLCHDDVESHLEVVDYWISLQERDHVHYMAELDEYKILAREDDFWGDMANMIQGWITELEDRILQLEELKLEILDLYS